MFLNQCIRNRFLEKLLTKLTKEGTFSVNNCLNKQSDGCPMDGPISVVFRDFYMCKMEYDVVVPVKPIFYKRYVDDTYVRRKKNTKDELFEKLKTYHGNINIKRNVQLRWNEHEHVRDKNSECVKHLNENDNFEFKSSVLSLALKFSFKRNILEAYFARL